MMPEWEPNRLSAELSNLTGMDVYLKSIVPCTAGYVFLAKQPRGEKHVGLVTEDAGDAARIAGRQLSAELFGKKATVVVGATTAENAASARDVLPFVRARTIGLRKSAGCGDRLGLATPGHIRALRGLQIEPVLAQQSVRENARTGRTPRQVMDDAMWGVLQEGWQAGFGADADHLKTTADVDQFVQAGYTFYTFDPGEFVDNKAEAAPKASLPQMVEALPWDALESSPLDLTRSLADRPISIGDYVVTISPVTLQRAAAKYGRAVAHTLRLYRHLVSAAGTSVDVEMSVDETDTETTIPEHVYIAHELKRLGVRWVSLAPRYFGRFEKGVDYIGDVGRFELSFARHVAVARTFGPYKLSLHSGSDKFAIYPVVARLTGDLVHLKTAGTSYLEALRTIASKDGALFRDITSFALSRYPADRASYHVSAEVGRMPDVTRWADSQLPELLENFDARQVLHVTFGSVIHEPSLRGRFFAVLRSNEESYYEMLESHFRRHLDPFK